MIQAGLNSRFIILIALAVGAFIFKDQIKETINKVTGKEEVKKE